MTGHILGDARKRLAERANTDTCQTPGCGHARGEHYTVTVGDQQTTNCIKATCPCLCFTGPNETVSERPQDWCNNCGHGKGHHRNYTKSCSFGNTCECQRFVDEPTREQVLADAEAAWETWREAQRHPVLYYDSTTFIAGYLAGKGINE